MKNKEIIKILNNIKKLEEKPGFNTGWNCCLDTILMDFREKILEDYNKN